MEFDDFVIQFSTMVLLACAAFFGVVAVAWYVNKVLEARGKRLESAQDKLDILVGGKEIHDRYLDPAGGFNKDMAQRTPTVDERLKILESRVTGVGCNFVNADAAISKRIDALERSACARADGIEAKLSKLEERVRQIDEARKIHEDVVGGVLKRHRAEIDILAKRRAPKKRAR